MYVYVYICIYLYICIQTDSHVYCPFQDSLVWLGLTTITTRTFSLTLMKDIKTL